MISQDFIALILTQRSAPHTFTKSARARIDAALISRRRQATIPRACVSHSLERAYVSARVRLVVARLLLLFYMA
jgi:hypothetical protein